MKQLSFTRFSLRQIHATSYKDSHTAKLSMTVLYTIVAAALTVFVLFFTVGYDRAFEENADFNAPMLTDALLMTLYLLTGMTLVLIAGAAIRQLRHHNKSDDVVNNVPAKRIAIGSGMLLVASMAMTFALASTSPIVTNGTAFADPFWLRTAGMFVDTIILLVVVATGIVVLCLCGVNRKL